MNIVLFVEVVVVVVIVVVVVVVMSATGGLRRVDMILRVLHVSCE